ncbi:50S ribosomal protein L6 [Candidatus Parcubacteria bacterium]|nr:MAG: 50S ribosomal protein L6 [Candidatus Parcubacteria bacterium]
MSRVGKKPVEIPQGVEVKVNNFQVNVKGPKGSLQLDLPKGVSAEVKDNQVLLSVNNPDAGDDKALWGLARSLVNNTVLGVTKGFSKELEINGVGFKVALQGKKLVLNVGFSHPVEYNLPEGISAEVEKNSIKLMGIDKQLLGQTAAEIRGIKKPEPYKGKGIKYVDEQIRRKAGKVVKAA